MHIYFSGHLLTANDLSAQQQATSHHGAGSAAAASSDLHHAGTPNESLLRSLPASILDTALNRQTAGLREKLASVELEIKGILNEIDGAENKEKSELDRVKGSEEANSGVTAQLIKAVQSSADMMDAARSLFR